MKPGIILLCTLIILVVASLAYSQIEPPGRYLPDGTWQPRKTHATLPEPAPGMPAQASLPNNRNHILSIDWEPEVMLAGPGLDAFFSSIAEGPNGYVHVVTSHDFSAEPYYFRSTDQGISWSDGFQLASIAAVEYNFIIDSNYVTFPFSASGGFSCVISSDYGDTWSDWRNVSLQGYGAPSVLVDHMIYSASVLDDHRIESRYSNDHGDRWDFQSYSNLLRDPSYLALGATNLGLHLLAVAPYGQEIYYQRNIFPNQGWGNLIRLSDDTTHDSFFPKIIAWGDSNVFAIWVDYKYSPYPWTGDLLARRSTDNGSTWLPEQQITFNHLALEKNICEKNDSLFLVYDEIVFDGETNTEEIFFNLTSDGGESWGEPVRLTNAPWRSIYPSVAVYGNQINVAFCDARNDTVYGNANSLYYKKGIISGSEVIGGNNINKPEYLSIESYPNPFNSSTLLTINNKKGGEVKIGIYDIQGKLIQKFERGGMGGDEKIVWDATDASGKKVSSGIYFARASTAQTEKTIKLLYIK